MPVALLPIVLGALLGSAGDASPAPAPAPTPAPAPPACSVVSAKLLAVIDTKIVKAGDRFRFSTSAATTYGGKEISAGTQGTGVVATLDHSKSQGQSGYLVIEARYLELADGSHLPATFVPGGDGRSDAYVRAGNSDAPPFIGFVPYVGIGSSIYDFFHHGKDAAVVAGAPLALVLGDDFLSGACSVTPR